MILDSLERCARYLSIHPAFPQAFEFLARPDLARLGPGRHSLAGDRLYVSIDHTEGRGRDGARIEAHQRYIDIQFTIDGHEEIGWSPLTECRSPTAPHDPARD